MAADAKQERGLQGTAQEGRGKARKSQGARAGGERTTGRFGSIKVLQCKLAVLTARFQVLRNSSVQSGMFLCDWIHTVTDAT